MKTLTALILILGTIGIGTYIYLKLLVHERGKALESINSIESLIAVPVWLIIFLLLAITGSLSLYFALRRKRFSALIASILVASSAYLVGFFPLPSHIEGIANTLSKYDERFYLNLSKPDNGAHPIPEKILNEFPELKKIFPPDWDIKFQKSNDHLDVFVSSGMGGLRGFRIYAGEDVNPYSNTAEYVGSFKKIKPKVYAYTRVY
jgi:hypothetical protein